MDSVSKSGFTIATCSTPKELVGLICELALEDGKLKRFGTFSTAIYDTAWLSMVHTKVDGQISWCFPECFEYLLRNQRDHGTWDAYASPLDGILNTLAALLSLLTRSKLDPDSPAEDGRIQKARAGLQSLLQTWNVDENVNVGFEIIMPALLRQVEQHDICFDFPDRQRLFQLHQEKLEKFKPTMVYSKQQTTLLHSLEALIGLIDFDNVSQHCSEETGIFGSPASTAAYLLNCSKWDERAERYLRNTVNAVGDYGGVPSAFPTCLFEISWVLSTLLPQVISVKDLEVQEVRILSSFLAESMESQKGVVGFAPGVLEDADDTARSLLALQLLGNDVDPNPMIEKFQSDVCFKTYELEQNPSFSANCNVLMALLGSESVNEHLLQIEKTLRFLLLEWEKDVTHEKWNLSPQYLSMLLSGALLRLLERWEAGYLENLPTSLIQQQLPICLCRILSKTLNEQQEAGSWTGSIEVTAYSVLTVAQCLSLPWSARIRDSLVSCLTRGRDFITSQQPTGSGTDYLWVEKVTFGSHCLQKAYSLSALHTPYDQKIWSKRTMNCFSLPETINEKMRHLFSKLPLFKQSPLISIDLAFLEAVQFSKHLKEERHTIFPRNNMPMTKDEYLEYIPIIWIACNQIGGHALSSDVVRCMLSLSLFNYQADEYMESVVVHLEEQSLHLLLTAIADECQLESNIGRKRAPQQPLSPRSSPKADSDTQGPDSQSESMIASIDNVLGVLTKYIRHILQHPAVLRSSQSTQKELAVEVYNYLFAQIDHNSHNVRLRAQRNLSNGITSGYTPPDLKQSSYLNWVRSTAADDTSCPFSFQFFTCLVSPSGCFEGPRARYLSRSLARHLATMCRQYNDYGSAVRDMDEGNLNSLDFPEFHRGRGVAVESDTAVVNDKNPSVNVNGARRLIGAYPTDGMKSELMEIAEFERACMHLAQQKLGQTLGSPAIMNALQVFIDTTDLFGQIYVQKDIASRIRTDAHGAK